MRHLTNVAFFWLLTGLFIVPLFIGLPLIWFISYSIVFGIVAIFLIPLFICRYCPEYEKPGLLLKCSHWGIPKVYSYKSKPLNSIQCFFVYFGFAIIYGSGVILLCLIREYKLAVCAAYGSLVWVIVMRQTLCKTCLHPSCPMKKD